MDLIWPGLVLQGMRQALDCRTRESLAAKVNDILKSKVASCKLVKGCLP